MEGGHDPNAPEKRRPGVNVPPDVKSWWHATGSTLFANHPPTVTVPPFFFSWWEATGSAFVATKLDPYLPVVTTPAPALTSKPTESSPGANGGAGIPPPPSGVMTLQTSISTPTPLQTPSFSPKPLPKSTSTSSASTVDSSSTSIPTNTTPTFISSSFPISSDAVSPTPTPSSSTPINAASNKKTARIIAGVVVPLVLIFIGVAAFIIYKRRQRARDRREWERTHDAIADAVRQVGGTPAPRLPAWRPPFNDVKAPLEGDTAPLFEKSGDPSLPGPLEHTGGELHSGPASSLV
ncbi:hypothetical protein DFH08DRAFT_895409 [Mycena albidolilacea]|uniref:Uncharacterized protein n=1 Tax=Mycena albidolilacea TaxID=1033008 RepID=A0AAD6ZAT3_9AGAR|nr:hypothetical protein DFH08DRAFT_895409 [Mycena albidolilacea]